MGDWFRDWCDAHRVRPGTELFVCEDCLEAYPIARIRRQKAGEICPFCCARMELARCRGPSR